MCQPHRSAPPAGCGALCNRVRFDAQQDVLIQIQAKSVTKREHYSDYQPSRSIRRSAFDSKCWFWKYLHPTMEVALVRMTQDAKPGTRYSKHAS